MIKYHNLFLVILTFSILLNGCKEVIHDSPIDAAYENLTKWRGLSSPTNEQLYNDIKTTLQKNIPYKAVLLQERIDSDLLFIVHVGWTVAICQVSQNLTIINVRSFEAKLGFSVSLLSEIEVTLHKHPGTNMFLDIPLSVSIKNKKLTIEEKNNSTTIN